MDYHEVVEPGKIRSNWKKVVGGGVGVRVDI